MVLGVPPRPNALADSGLRGPVNRLRRFRKNEDGAVTVELVLWVPVFMIILMLVVDASMLFVTQSNFWGVARDSARRVAVNTMTGTEAETWALDEASFGSVVPTVDVDTTGGNVTVTISTPFSDVDVFGLLGLSNLNLIAEVTQRIETP